MLRDDDGGSDIEDVTVSVTAVPPGAPGTLDPTFGSGGKLITDFESVFGDNGEGGEVAIDVAIQPDGKIVAVGSYDSVVGNSNFALARYLPTGELDPSFGTLGRVYTEFGGSLDSALAVAILPDGRILVSGTGGPGEYPGVVLARYTNTGDLDTSFGGGDGYVIENFGGLSQGSLGLAVANNGTIYVPVAGPSPSWGESALGSPASTATGRGTRISGTMARRCWIWPFIRSFSQARPTCRWTVTETCSLLCQPQSSDGYGYFAVAKYDLARGGLDPEFGSGGWAFTNFAESYGTGEYPFRLVVDPESGRIVAVGYVYGSVPQSFAIACYTPNGQLDPSFGDQGKVVPDLAQFGAYEGIATDVAIQSDGKVVVLGFTRSDPGVTDNAFSVLRLNADGQVDTTFGTGGLAAVKFNPYSDHGIAMAIQGDNSIVVAGVTYTQPAPPWIWWFGIDPDFAVARLFGGQLPASAVNKVTMASDRKGLVIQLIGSDLDPALATNPANFRLTAGGKDTNHRRAGVRRRVMMCSGQIDPGSITYDSNTDRITLAVRQRR